MGRYIKWKCDSNMKKKQRVKGAFVKYIQGIVFPNQMENDERKDSFLDNDGVATKNGFSIGITKIKKDEVDGRNLEVTYVVDAPTDTNSVWVKIQADSRLSSEYYEDDDDGKYRFQRIISVDLENNGPGNGVVEKKMLINREKNER
eukprot:540819_1